MKSIKQLIQQLNKIDECSDIEAKKANEVGRSIMETICAFSNEPGLGGGYILLGVEKENAAVSLFPEYTVTGIDQDKSDKIQTDIASQAASMFNRPVRPKINVETVNGKIVIVLFIDELSPEQKPLFFKNQRLPQGAYRRIGAADHQCTEDDMALFYQSVETLDQSTIKDAQIEDLSEDSINLYRKLREKVNPAAEELTYTNEELLMAVTAIKRNQDRYDITYAGLLSFGFRQALRRLLPMVRVDYIRTSDNEWIGNTEQRFVSTLDMRGSLLEMVQRVIYTINDDLPKGFELTDDNIQAKNKGLPYRVLREAVVNALIHRSYRENSPIHIIRYPNRIEITNPGFSLKTEDQLGKPGSINRNPFIAAIFHDTNLAETKGSGIRFMQRKMNENGMMPPTFESDRQNNRFTIRLLLHHLLDEKDLEWLGRFADFNLSDSQKRILIFVREVGAVDNASARQINGYEPTNANSDLRKLTQMELLTTKGRNRFTYYIPSSKLKDLFPQELDIKENIGLSTKLSALPTNLSALPTNLSAPPTNLSAPLASLSAPVSRINTLPKIKIEEFISILHEIEELPQRITDKDILKHLIIRLCNITYFKLSELSIILGRTEKYILRDFIRPLLVEKKIEYTYPDMINHPEQAYKTVVN